MCPICTVGLPASSYLRVQISKFVLSTRSFHSLSWRCSSVSGVHPSKRVATIPRIRFVLSTSSFLVLYVSCDATLNLYPLGGGYVIVRHSNVLCVPELDAN